VADPERSGGCSPTEGHHVQPHSSQGRLGGPRLGRGRGRGRRHRISATPGPTREEFSQLKTRVLKQEEQTKLTVERNAKLETRVTNAEASATSAGTNVSSLQGRLVKAESSATALAVRVSELESAPPVEVPPVKEETPVVETPPVKEETPVVEAPHEAPTQTSNCFASPSSCGFPSEATGANVATLTPSGSITASTAGQVIENKDVTGQITVTAPNVTIRNVRVTATESGSGSAAISGNQPGLKVINTTVRGKGSGASTVEAAVRDYSGLTIEGSNLTLCNECVQGWPLTVKNSYMKVSSIYSGAHAEDIYICSGTVNVDHSTLLNEQGQTATVFGDTICGGKNNYTVTQSLLAGGGYVFYPQANGSGSGGTTTITGNRIARCVTAETTSSDGHHLCKSGADSSGYFPGGGGYGVGAYFSGALTWSGNVWDNSGATIPSP
jgi:hypothetical protein